MKLQQLRNKIAYAFASWVFLCGAFFSQVGAQAVPTCFQITSGNLTYTENFDSLGTGGGTAAPGAFGFVESDTSANGAFVAGTGSSGTGDTYNFGDTAAATDRAFGGLLSGSLTPIIGACFTNNTSSPLRGFSIGYAGEQYRLGATGRADRLDFQFSTNATSLTTGTYVDVNVLDFNSPTTTGSTGELDGNSSRTVIPLTQITLPTPIPVGSTIFIRFSDFNAAGSDDGLAIDDFTFSVATATAASVSVGGRVLGANNRPVIRALVYLTDQNGETRTAMTNSFGYYRFQDVNVGQSYTINVLSKRYLFEPQILTVNQEMDNLNFLAQP